MVNAGSISLRLTPSRVCRIEMQANLQPRHSFTKRPLMEAGQAVSTNVSCYDRHRIAKTEHCIEMRSEH